MAFYLVGTYVNANGDAVMTQLNSMSDPAANLYQESLVKGFQYLGQEIFPQSFKIVSSQLYCNNYEFYEIWCRRYSNVAIKPRSYIRNLYECFTFLHKRLKYSLLQNDVVVLYSLNIASIVATILACRKYHNKICLVITDLPLYMSANKSISYRIMKWLANILIKISIRKIQYFCILSKYMSEYLPKEAKYTVVEGIYTIHNFVTIESKRVEGRILYSGTLAERYGIKELLSAFTLLKNENYTLIVCGRGDSEEFVKEMARKDSRIHFLGSKPHDEILQLQATSSLLVNPRPPKGKYVKYSFPSKTMEYLASGTPTLLYKLPGIPAEYYNYCYSLDDLSITTLANAIDRILSLPEEERIQFGKKAQQFILNTKNAKKQCAKILKLIEN